MESVDAIVTGRPAVLFSIDRPAMLKHLSEVSEREVAPVVSITLEQRTRARENRKKALKIQELKSYCYKHRTCYNFLIDKCYGVCPRDLHHLEEAEIKQTFRKLSQKKETEESVWGE